MSKCVLFLSPDPLWIDIQTLWNCIWQGTLLNSDLFGCLFTWFEVDGNYRYLFFKASALWADAFYKSKCPSVCPCVCLFVCVFTFEVPFKPLFALTSQSRMSNIFRDSESLGKSNGKNWSQIWTFLFESCLKLPRIFFFFFLLILPYKTWWKPLFPTMD